MTDKKKIRIAIIGIGNCASSLVQGLHKYKDVDENSGFVHGVAHNKIGDYLISDIEVVSAFDVDGRKAGKDLSEAIFSEPNCTTKFFDVPKTGINVQKGPVLDGILDSQHYVYDYIDEKQSPVEVCKVLQERKVDIVINYLPSGSIEATHYYAEQALDADCSFVNAIAVELANDPVWMRKFTEKGLILAGDDIKSQLGSTILHQTILDLFVKRGVFIESTHQINLGGNTDFKNLSNPERFKEKFKCKQSAIDSSIPYNTNASLLPCTYTNGLNDNKHCHIRINGEIFGNSPIKIDIKLEVEDSPDSAGSMIDLIRLIRHRKEAEYNDFYTHFNDFFKKPFQKSIKAGE